MKHAILAILAIAGLSAHGELKMAVKPQPLYLSESGEQLSPVEAVKRSIKGERVLKCDQVEAQASETGNVSLKKVK